jgi:hypothetical protein
MKHRLLIALTVFLALSILVMSPSANQNKSTTDTEQFKIIKFDEKNLPKNIEYKGKIVKGASWIDKNGENILILTQTGKIKSKVTCEIDECFDAEIYAYNFLLKGSNITVLWQIIDFERNCPLDLYAGFIKESLFITDLDSNGEAESTFLYKLSCRSDVSPSTLKLIMHEGSQKYAIRGTTKLEEGLGGGEMNVGAEFSKAKATLKSFAIIKWESFVTKDEFDQF